MGSEICKVCFCVIIFFDEMNDYLCIVIIVLFIIQNKGYFICVFVMVNK